MLSASHPSNVEAGKGCELLAHAGSLLVVKLVSVCCVHMLSASILNGLNGSDGFLKLVGVVCCLHMLLGFPPSDVETGHAASVRRG